MVLLDAAVGEVANRAVAAVGLVGAEGFAGLDGNHIEVPNGAGYPALVAAHLADDGEKQVITEGAVGQLPAYGTQGVGADAAADETLGTAPVQGRPLPGGCGRGRQSRECR